jgi:DNA-directed RNA polymerase specialized sigma24 family protein
MNRSQPPLRAPSAWLGPLRERLLEVARRRVSAEAVEDVVQEALTVIHEKGPLQDAGAGVDAEGGPPPLPWCFRVLRNVIGNHYQKQRTRDRAARVGAAEHAKIVELYAGRSNPTPVEALEHLEISRLLEDSIAELAGRDGECGRLLRLALGRIEPEPGSARTSTSTEYVRAFRCRQRLKGILLRRGYVA